jgi:predicted  nucleic acid-binding Zn-ribbon protein
VGSGVDGFGTKGASMNQVMINAVELDSLLKEVEYLKHENQKLEEQLKDAQGRIRVLKEDVGFAERGYTKVGNS